MSVTKSEVISVINSKAGEIYKVTGSLSAAQINASDTTPIEIIAAPGANKVIQILSVISKYTFVSTPYVATTDLTLNYNGGANIAAILIPSSTLLGGLSQIEILTLNVGIPIENNNVSIASLSAISGGDGTVLYEIIYKIISF